MIPWKNPTKTWATHQICNTHGYPPRWRRLRLPDPPASWFCRSGDKVPTMNRHAETAAYCLFSRDVSVRGVLLMVARQEEEVPSSFIVRLFPDVRILARAVETASVASTS